jgi:hypothetical protein
MSELQPLVDKLFAECHEMCKTLTREATIEETKVYEGKLMLLVSTWIDHNKRTVELLNTAIWKCEQNKQIILQRINQEESSR